LPSGACEEARLKGLLVSSEEDVPVLSNQLEFPHTGGEFPQVSAFGKNSSFQPLLLESGFDVYSRKKCKSSAKTGKVEKNIRKPQ
jgi:hypothetical protein